tara:strand:- start:725 stop:1099 length:375 start_codon:yes stop_codon:yes gene_type:complete
MARLTQLIKKTSCRLDTKSSTMSNCPQRRVVCKKVLTISPKKPNSANRRVCKVKLLKTKQILTVKIPGEGHNIQQHSTILIRGGRSRDLIGVRNIAIRGKYDLLGVSNRKTSRSRYGVKRPINN